MARLALYLQNAAADLGTGVLNIPSRILVGEIIAQEGLGPLARERGAGYRNQCEKRTCRQRTRHKSCRHSHSPKVLGRRIKSYSDRRDFTTSILSIGQGGRNGPTSSSA